MLRINFFLKLSWNIYVKNQFRLETQLDRFVRPLEDISGKSWPEAKEELCGNFYTFKKISIRVQLSKFVCFIHIYLFIYLFSC